MHLLCLSGSLRAASTNTALLRCVTAAAARHPGLMSCDVFAGLASIPPFSPDHEGAATPAPVLDFARAVGMADGLIIACPEYVHAMPGAFKNALDWLVSREELIHKPIALLHASHRGEDVLADLRRVLATVSTRFAPDIFARFALGNRPPEQVQDLMTEQGNAAELRMFLDRFASFIAAPTAA